MLFKFAEVLSNLLIGLLAVLIPVFALMTSILARAIQDGREKLEKDVQRIFKDLQEIRRQESADPELAIKELRKAIKRYSWLRRGARLKQFFLSSRASIYYPGILFLVSLLLLMPALSSNAQITTIGFRLIITAVSLSVVGIGILVGVIETIYTYASTFEPPTLPDAPELQVYFSNRASVVVWPSGTSQDFKVVIHNTGDYIAEKILAYARFRPEFKVEVRKGVTGVKLVKQPDNSTAAFWEATHHHSHVWYEMAPLTVTIPATNGEFSIPVRLSAEKMKMTQTELKIVAG